MLISLLSWMDELNKVEPVNPDPLQTIKEKPKKEKRKTVELANLWTRCDNCGTVLYIKHLKQNENVCFACDYHLQMNSRERIKSLIDRGTWRPLDESLSPCNPLNFCDQKPYNERLKEAQERTQLQDAILTGTGLLDSIPVAMGVMDFNFMGGSMGSVVGEKITRLIELATRKGYVLILICASGGARMQEGILSLMQMAKISAALNIHQSYANLLYISILTSPTTGGVTASFAMLGDLIFAEPNALIGFAGRRVIEQTLNEELPPDFQTAEYLLDHGLCDLIIPRSYLKGALSEVISVYTDLPFRKQGELPAKFQNPFDFLTQEKIRRRFLKNKKDKVFEKYSDYLELSSEISLLTRFLYADSLKLANLFPKSSAEIYEDLEKEKNLENKELTEVYQELDPELIEIKQDPESNEIEQDPRSNEIKQDPESNEIKQEDNQELENEQNKEQEIFIAECEKYCSFYKEILISLNIILEY